MRDVSSYLSTQQAMSPPDKASMWTEMEELYNKRLWHQLTLKLLIIVKDPDLQKGTLLVDMYENFLADFESKINPLSLVEIVKFIVKQITDYDQALKFIANTKEKVKSNAQAVVLCNIITGRFMLEKNDLDKVKEVLEETRTLIDSMDGVSPVHGRFYQLSSDYYQVMGQHALYYRDALRYLGCTELKDMSSEEQQQRAFTLSLAALLGEGVFDFGELLAHPVISCLKGTSKQWVVDMLEAFNVGSLEKYEALRPYWTAQPDLAAHELQIRQKISLLCLMEMTFRRPGNLRTLTFSEIASETRLPDNEVELLVMKALSLKLVRGSIDQVDRIVNMRWVQPRVLALGQISGMKQRLDQWCLDVQSMERLLETKAHDILT